MATPSRSKASPDRIAIAQREGAALELRKAGRTYDEIARMLDYSERSGAAKAVRRALAATVQEPADELRRLEVERLDSLLAAMWPLAMDGKLGAVDRVLSLMDRRAKLLGLDAPQRRAVDGVTRDAFMQAVAGLESEISELESAVERDGS
jgi:hypothetical protein